MTVQTNEKSKEILRDIRKLANNDKRLQHNDWRNIAALEKAVERLQKDRLCSKHLTFKGGFVLFKHFESLRFTRDVDALATQISKDKFLSMIKKALAHNKIDDGFWFGDIKIQELIEQGNYGNFRFNCAYQIGNPNLEKIYKLSRIHIDINFNDKIPFKENEQTMVSILANTKSIQWKIYPAEYTLAEKLHAFIEKGSANSRAKDLYDVPFLFTFCDSTQKLKQAITHTFKNRQTPLPSSFQSQSKSIDLSFLKAAWPGVLVLGEKPKFEKIWKDFTVTLVKIDQIVQKST